jgi:hypothetical protein
MARQNLQCAAFTQEIPGKTPWKEMSMLFHSGADMSPIWILRTLLTDVHIRKGLLMTHT